MNNQPTFINWIPDGSNIVTNWIQEQEDENSGFYIIKNIQQTSGQSYDNWFADFWIMTKNLDTFHYESACLERGLYDHECCSPVGDASCDHSYNMIMSD